MENTSQPSPPEAQATVTDTEVLEELLADDSDANTAEDALLVICQAAQTDPEFNGLAVQHILQALGLQGFWEEAEALKADDESTANAETPEPSE